MSIRSQMRSKLRIRNSLVREALAEFLGTFILILIGNGSVAQSVLSSGTKGKFLSINWGWGIAVCMGVFMSGNVSGGHINPAVSLTMAVLHRISWVQFIVYSLAQYLGAFVASATVYGVYYDALNSFDGGVRQITGENGTAGIWATYPQSYLTPGIGFLDQVVGTALLTGCVMAITDNDNQLPHKGIKPFLIGLVVFAIGTSFGYNFGYAINPARDLAPRIFTLVAGWGVGTFSHRNYMWFWIPVLGPHVGGLIGAFVYLLFIGNHWPADDSANYTVTAEKYSEDDDGGGIDGPAVIELHENSIEINGKSSLTVKH